MRSLRVLTVLVLTCCWAFLGPAPHVSAAQGASNQDALHEVMSGDDLRLIAGYYYGDTRQWTRIWEANRDLIKNPNRIERGTYLRIPNEIVPAEPYAEYVARTRAVAAAKAPGIVVPPVPPEPGTPPRETAIPPAISAESLPQGEPLPPPSQPVTLRFRPSKGFTQTTVVTGTSKTVMETMGQALPMDARLKYRFRMAVDNVDVDGAVHLVVGVSDPEMESLVPVPFPFAAAGLPELGETLRVTASPLSRIVQVEGKDPESLYYASPVLPVRYPEAPLSVGKNWQYEERARTPDGMVAIAKNNCSLVRRERFLNEEAYRIQCQGSGTGSHPSMPDLRASVTETRTIVVRARDGIPMFTDSIKEMSSEAPSQKIKISMESRTTFLREATSGPEAAPPPAISVKPEAPAKPPTKAQAPSTPAPPTAKGPAPAPPAPAKGPAPAAAPATPAPAKQAAAPPAPPAAKAPAPPAKGPTKAAPPPPKEWYEELLSPEFFTSIEFMAGAGVLVLALLGFFLWRRKKAGEGS